MTLDEYNYCTLKEFKQTIIAKQKQLMVKNSKKNDSKQSKRLAYANSILDNLIEYFEMNNFICRYSVIFDNFMIKQTKGGKNKAGLSFLLKADYRFLDSNKTQCKEKILVKISDHSKYNHRFTFVFRNGYKRKDLLTILENAFDYYSKKYFMLSLQANKSRYFRVLKQYHQAKLTNWYVSSTFDFSIEKNRRFSSSIFYGS